MEINDLLKALRREFRTKRNTRVGISEGSLIVKLHSTNIAVLHSNMRDVTLNSGGWDTRTTKRRIIETLGLLTSKLEINSSIGLYSKRGTWYLYGRCGGYEEEFMDGMCVNLYSPDFRISCGDIAIEMSEEFV